MQKFLRMLRVYISFVIFHVSLMSLGASENLENSLALFGKTLENLTTIIQAKSSIRTTPTRPEIPKKSETPTKPVIPKKPVSPKVPITPKKPETPKAPETSKTPQDDIGHFALQYTNEHRAKNGLAPLAWNQKLADLSTEHSKNMAEGKVPFGHDGFQNRVARYPGRYTGAAENVYMTSSGRSVARDAVDGWIKSPGHNRNLLGNYTACGIGAYKGQRGWYVTQMFARF